MKSLLLSLVLISSALLGYSQSEDWRYQYFGQSVNGIPEASDFDADGDKDIIEIQNFDNGCLLYLRENTGDSFAEETALETYTLGFISFRTAFVDDDIYEDVVLVLEDGQVAWIKNLEGEGFTSLIYINQQEAETRRLELADLDGDGDNDLLTMGRYKLTFYRNNNGDFGPPTDISVPSLNNIYPEFQLADSDGDGDLDLYAQLYGPENLVLLLNDGNGIFTYNNPILDVATSRFDVVDLNSDGQNELIILKSDSVKVYELEDGAYIRKDALYFDFWSISNKLFHFESTSQGAIVFGLADTYGSLGLTYDQGAINELYNYQDYVFNRDNDKTYALADFDGDTSIDLYNRGNILYGVSDANPTIGEIPSKESVIYLTHTDMNSDGFEDLIVYSDGVGMLLNVEGDSFSNYIPLFDVNKAPDRIAGEDLANDGVKDFVMMLDCIGVNDTLVVANQVDEGSWEVVKSGIDSWWEGEKVFEFADIDDDGRLDFIAASSTGGECNWISCEADLSFSNVLNVHGNNVWTCTPIDYNENGLPDLLFGNTSTSKVRPYRNLGGSFAISPYVYNYNWYDGGRYVEGADIDYDGDMDIITTNGGSLIMEKVGPDDYDGHTFTLSGKPIVTELDLEGFKEITAENDIVWIDDNFDVVETTSLSNYLTTINIVDTVDFNNDGWMDLVSVNVGDVGIALLENRIGKGCLDEAACNYDPIYIINDLEDCCYDDCGCDDPNATNYNENVSCNNGSCKYEIEGFVWFDEDSDGNWDLNETPLSNHIVNVQPTGAVAITNDEGYFFVQTLEGNYVLTANETEEFPYNTTPNPQIINTEGQLLEPVLFGLSSNQVVNEICVDLYPNGNAFLCNSTSNHNICFRNEGNQTVSGYVALTYDELFQGYQEVTPIDSVVGNTIYMGFEDLEPGVMFMYDVLLYTPSEEFFGQEVTSTAIVSSLENDAVLAQGEQLLTMEVLCAYDPNDKQVFPNGYEEPHYVLNDTELEYLVRFQNTGNYPANTVLVTDTLDENLDLSTFNLMANSHSVSVFIDPETRAIQFLHQEINLPDSVSNEPDSHGLVSFKIRPYPGLEAETEINNTANIYFDNNPPIITNTTWNTIYDCNDDLATISSDASEFCGNEVSGISNDQEYVEAYEWYLDGELFSTDQSINEETDLAGVFSIEHVARNPLCVAMQEIDVEILPFPENNAGDDIEACEGEQISLSASGGESNQWAGFESEGNQVILADSSAVYYVTTSNGLGCTGLDSLQVSIIPFPELILSEDITVCEGEETILTASGGDYFIWEGETEGSSITLFPTTSDYIEVESFAEGLCTATDSVFVEVLAYPIISISETGIICVGDEITLTVQGEADSFLWSEGSNSETQTVAVDEDLIVSVIAANGGCASEESITLQPLPLPIIEVSGSSETCVGETVTLTASGATNYVWNDEIAGDDLTVTVEEDLVISVVGSDGNCESQVIETSITALPLPDAVFTADGIVLTANTGTNWQWYLNGNAIDGATSQTIEIAESGDYSVEIVNEFGCSATSEELFILFVGVDEAGTNAIVVYPNPTVQTITIQFGSPVSCEHIRLVDQLGRVVYETSYNGTQTMILSLPELANGNYELIGMDKGNVQFHKTIQIRK